MRLISESTHPDPCPSLSRLWRTRCRPTSGPPEWSRAWEVSGSWRCTGSICPFFAGASLAATVLSVLWGACESWGAYRIPIKEKKMKGSFTLNFGSTRITEKSVWMIIWIILILFEFKIWIYQQKKNYFRTF